MTDFEKRAHDIAVAILPDMIKEDRRFQKWNYFEDNGDKFNCPNVMGLYYSAYEALVNDLQEYYLGPGPF